MGSAGTEAHVEDLIAYTLRHADDCLVLSHRLAEWSSRAPDLEEDIALTNIGLDLLGQARLLYSYAGELDGHTTEDDYAYLRNERQYTNLLLVEQPNGDFAKTIVRQLMFSTYQQHLWDQLQTSSDPTLAAIAAKAAKETAYHLRHARTWVQRLGKGTSESHARMQWAVDALWRFSDELFKADELDHRLAQTGVAVNADRLAQVWHASIEGDLSGATLALPVDLHQTDGGRLGRHTNHLGLMLAEMQVLHRAHPGATW
jgi:ring-1,2-phenylacetyl-CoA epoxidase subunit PaaC